MFQFSGFPLYSYVLAVQYWSFSPVGFPIQISADQLVFANPRSFSQLITSFFGSQCLGIHPMLLLLNQFPTCFYKCFEILACISFSDLQVQYLHTYLPRFVQVLPCTLGCLTLLKLE